MSEELNMARSEAKIPTALVVVAAVWLTIILGAMLWIACYSNSPGPSRSAFAHWPAESRIPFDESGPTLIMFAHPRCPCTRASLGELDSLMARSRGLLTAHVLFIRPAGLTEDWVKTDLWRKAAAIPGVTVHCDSGGVEAYRFQAETSGYTVLYDRTGRLIFQGGITLARGHSGDNTGLTAIGSLLHNQAIRQNQTPVFGCSLFDPETQIANKVCKK
jgi:hypothetical protein